MTQPCLEDAVRRAEQFLFGDAEMISEIPNFALAAAATAELGRRGLP